jgi:hypothetical protein
MESPPTDFQFSCEDYCTESEIQFESGSVGRGIVSGVCFGTAVVAGLMAASACVAQQTGYVASDTDKVAASSSQYGILEETFNRFQRRSFR